MAGPDYAKNRVIVLFNQRQVSAEMDRLKASWHTNPPFKSQKTYYHYTYYHYSAGLATRQKVPPLYPWPGPAVMRYTKI